MGFKIDSLKEVVERARNAFRAELPGSDAWVWPNNIYVTAKVIGGMVWMLMGYLKWIDKQRFAMTATGENLLRHGAEYGLSIKAPTFARGNVIVSSDTYPLTIGVGTQFTRDDGAVYNSTVAVDLDRYSGRATIPVMAAASGNTSNAVYGTPLTCSLSAVTSAVVDDFGLGQGTNGETMEQFRQRILDRKRQPPQGGAAFDYDSWAKEVPGVTRVFVQPLAFGPGTVGVWFLMDGTYANGIPQPADVTAVQAYIDGKKPATANVIVQAPIADCIDVLISDLSPNTQATREAVAAELKAFFNREAFVGTEGQKFTLYSSWLWTAVSNASGEKHHRVISPPDDIEFLPGTMPCLRSVRFT